MSPQQLLSTGQYDGVLKLYHGVPLDCLCATPSELKVFGEALAAAKRHDELDELTRSILAGPTSESLRYVCAFFRMLLRQYHECLEMLSVANSQTSEEGPSLRFKTKILLLEVKLHLRWNEDVAELFASLDALKSHAEPDELILLGILLGKYYSQYPNNLRLAERYLHRALQEATVRGVLPLIIAAGFHLTMLRQRFQAAAFVEKHPFSAMNDIIGIRESLGVYEMSQETTGVSNLLFDETFFTVTYRGNIISLATKPLVYKMLRAIVRMPDGVSRRGLSTQLWPSQIYKRRTHDPRIYDIAKRIHPLIDKLSQGNLRLQHIDGRYFVRSTERGDEETGTS